MSKVYKLGIVKNNNKKIEEVNSIEVIANKGVVGDRHFQDYNDPYCQLTLIESENIDYYNIKYGLNISHIDFRRNIITKEIQLNNFPEFTCVFFVHLFRNLIMLSLNSKLCLMFLN